MGRDRRFRFKDGGIPELGALTHLVCSRCASEFPVRTVAENYFFTCPICREIGNLPGVLAAQVDREFMVGSDEHAAKLAEIETAFPHPEPLKS